MDAKQLKTHAANGRVDLIIESLPNCLYQPFAVIDGSEQVIEKQGKTVRAFSLGDLHRQLLGIAFSNVSLRQRSAYDEMIGQAAKATDNQLLVNLDWQHIGDISARH
ncbi:MAG: septin family protein [Cellvibrionaceae bacterium]|nr:septin family protein [Cellvibrionaceae bacterium]MCV6628004.1 septin family protein [Cellvibrionaceae bacterium]